MRQKSWLVGFECFIGFNREKNRAQNDKSKVSHLRLKFGVCTLSFTFQRKLNIELFFFVVVIVQGAL